MRETVSTELRNTLNMCIQVQIYSKIFTLLCIYDSYLHNTKTCLIWNKVAWLRLNSVGFITEEIKTATYFIFIN